MKIAASGITVNVQEARKLAELPGQPLAFRVFYAAVGYAWESTRTAIIPAPRLREILANADGSLCSGSRQRKAVRQAVELGLLAEGSKDGRLILPPLEIEGE